MECIQSHDGIGHAHQIKGILCLIDLGLDRRFLRSPAFWQHDEGETANTLPKLRPAQVSEMKMKETAIRTGLRSSPMLADFRDGPVVGLF